MIFVNSPWFHFQFHESPLFSRIQKTINSHVNFLHIHYLFRESTMNLVSVTLTHLEFINFFANSLSFSRIHYDLTFLFAITIWIHIFSWIQTRFDICFANSLWINYQLDEFTIDSLSFSPIFYGSIIISAISIWIHYQFHELTIFNVFCELRIDSSYLRSYCYFTFFFAIYNGSFIISANSLWIYYQLD